MPDVPRPAPPSSTRPPAWAIALIAAGVLLGVLVGGVIVAGVAVRRSAERLVGAAQHDLPAAQAAGAAFGAGHGEADCLDQALQQVDACGQLELVCQLGATVFTQACLERAADAPATCAGAPAPGQPGIEAWSAEACAARGRTGDAACAALFQKAVLPNCRGEALPDFTPAG
jgi:hypothetical protein